MPRKCLRYNHEFISQLNKFHIEHSLRCAQTLMIVTNFTRDLYSLSSGITVLLWYYCCCIKLIVPFCFIYRLTNLHLTIIICNTGDRVCFTNLVALISYSNRHKFNFLFLLRNKNHFTFEIAFV